jgi:histidine ammonia-lyase
MYVHSIPNNNDNQDIVSMGCNAALMTKRVIDNSFEVLAIHLVTILQAIDYLDCHDSLATASRSIYDKVRPIFPKFIEDKARYKEMELVKDFLENSDHFITSK